MRNKKLPKLSPLQPSYLQKKDYPSASILNVHIRQDSRNVNNFSMQRNSVNKNVTIRNFSGPQDELPKNSPLHHEKQFIARTRLQDRLSSTPYKTNNKKNRQVPVNKNIKSKPVLNPATTNNFFGNVLTITKLGNKNIVHRSPKQIEQKVEEKEISLPQSRPDVPKKIDLSTQLTESIGKYSIKLSSMQISFTDINTGFYVPLQNLAHFIFKTEQEIIEFIPKNVSQAREWLNIYKNPDPIMIPDNFPYLSYKLDWERVLILLTPEAVKQGKIGDTIRKLQSKGLILKDSKLLSLTAKMMERLFSGRLKDSEEKSLAMCWEGQNVKNMIKNFSKDPKDLGTETMYLLYWPELVAPKLSVVFNEDEMKKWDFPTEPKELQIPDKNIKINFPTVELKIGNFSKKYPITLGLLKKIVENNFIGWGSICINYFQEFQVIFNGVKIDSDYQISQFIEAKYQRKVQIIFNCPKLYAKSDDFKAKYLFKKDEIGKLLRIASNSGTTLISSLLTRISFDEKIKDAQDYVKLTIDLSTNEAIKKGSTNLDDSVEQLTVDKKPLLFSFRTPVIEVIFLDDRSKHSYKIPHDLLEKLIATNFQNWAEEISNQLNL